jgi:hypothetical protein
MLLTRGGAVSCLGTLDEDVCEAAAAAAEPEMNAG